MMKYYIGDFNCLKELGFLQNKYKTYWFLSSKNLEKHHCLFIDIVTRKIEYSHEEDLEVLQGLYE